MSTAPPIPSAAEVQHIIAIEDPLIRNLRITHCYHQLSAVLAARTGPNANWCTFATWASKQAGQTIRQEDLRRLLENRLRRSPATLQASQTIAAAVGSPGGQEFMSSPEFMLRTGSFKRAVERSSAAVSRGNRKVFEEIGVEFARFYTNCLPDAAPDAQNIARFCAALRPGEPPDGQDWLRKAFEHYYQALFEQNEKTRAELILLANVEIGFHEQTRLQPEIAESLDAGLVSLVQVVRDLYQGASPWVGWLQVINLHLRRLLGRPTALDLALRSLLAEVGVQLRQAITEIMMTIALPSGILLRLGQDLAAGYPEMLRQIAHPELRLLLAKHDPTPDSTLDTGVLDWADLPDRLHFIIDLFRCYQGNPRLLEPPFTPDQLEQLSAGKVPNGRL
jgi:hypothetical protein